MTPPGVNRRAAAWSLSTLLPTLVSLVAETHERGRILGFAHLFWNAAMILSALTGGLLFKAGSGLPFLLGAGGNAVAVVLVFSFFAAARRFTPGGVTREGENPQSS